MRRPHSEFGTAPIALFVFNRPQHTKRVLCSLSMNEEARRSDLFVFCDGPRDDREAPDVNEVRRIVRSTGSFRSVTFVERERNMGLARSVIEGVTTVIREHKRVIVLEDDVVTSKNFLRYMNDALEFYESSPKVFCVSGYSFPVDVKGQNGGDVYGYFRACSWGWGTWADRWESVDWDLKDYGKLLKSKDVQKLFHRGGSDLTRQLRLSVEGKRDSWFMRFQFSCSMQEKLCVYPVLPKAKNIGTDGTGANFMHRTQRFEVDVDPTNSKTKLVEITDVDSEIEGTLRSYFSLRSRLLLRLKDFFS